MTVDALSASDFPLNTEGDRRRVPAGLDTWLAECTSVNTATNLTLALKTQLMCLIRLTQQQIHLITTACRLQNFK